MKNREINLQWIFLIQTSGICIAYVTIYTVLKKLVIAYLL